MSSNKKIFYKVEIYLQLWIFELDGVDLLSNENWFTKRSQSFSSLRFTQNFLFKNCPFCFTILNDTPLAIWSFLSLSLYLLEPLHTPNRRHLKIRTKHYLTKNLEQVPIPGPWVSGPGSRPEQVPILGPGTRVLGPRVLGPRSRKRNWAEQVPFPGPGTWDPTKVHKNKVGHYLGSRVPGPRSQIAGSEVAGSHVLGPSWWVPTARSQLLGPSYCWVPLGGSLRVDPFRLAPSPVFLCTL